MKKWERIENGGFRGGAFQYCAGNSPIHRLGAGWKIILAVSFSAGAIAAREPWMLAGLLVVNLGLLSFSPPELCVICGGIIRFFLVQMAVILLLYLIKYGFAEGLWQGLRTGCQILLLFLPGTVLPSNDRRESDDGKSEKGHVGTIVVSSLYQLAVCSLLCP